MRSGGGPKKGSRYEREICKALSRWISEGQRDDVFWRTAMSGGRATIGLRSGEVRRAQAGDVGAIDALGEQLLKHVVIDTKAYDELNVFSGIVNDAGRLYRFWNELRDEARKFDKRPMLIARQNNMPAVCLLTPVSCEQLFCLEVYHASAVLPRWNCHVVLFDVFLREAKVPNLIQGIGREGRVARIIASV